MGGHNSRYVGAFGMFALASLQPIVIGAVYLMNTEIIQLHTVIMSKSHLNDVRLHILPIPQPRTWLN